MEPPETRAAGQKDEKEKGCLRVELKNKQSHPAGRAGMKSCKHKKAYPVNSDNRPKFEHI